LSELPYSGAKPRPSAILPNLIVTDRTSPSLDLPLHEVRPLWRVAPLVPLE